MAGIQSNNYEAVADWAISQYWFLSNENHRLITINALRNILFDLKPIYSGYTSREAIDRGYKKSQMTVEHYHSRQRMATMIVGLVQNSAAYDEVLASIKEACMVHYTTKEENLALIPYQKQAGYIWEEAYAAVGIELVEYDPTVKDYQYDGQIYQAKSRAELARRLGLSTYKASKLIDEV